MTVRSAVRAALACALLSVGLPAAAPAPAAAQTAPQSSLDDVERQLREGKAEQQRLRDEAQTLRQEEQRLRDKSVRAAAEAQRLEQEILTLEARLDRLSAREAEAAATLADQRKRFAALLSALQRIARYPPEALMTQPFSPNDTVRGAILLRSAVPEVERRAEALRRDVDALAAARRQIETRRTQLAEARSALETQAIELVRLAESKASLRSGAQNRYDEARKRVAKLAGEAKSLKELMARLQDERIRSAQEAARAAEERAERLAEQARRKAALLDAARNAAAAGGAPVQDVPAQNPTRLDPAGGDEQSMQTAALVPPAGFTGRPFSDQRGRLPYPAVGRVVKRFGSKTEGGGHFKGADIRTAPAATVVAPFEGKIVYAGPFRSYGRLLIIEHGGGYHTLLAGLARLDVATGVWVLAGEPVGVMGRPAGAAPVLYIELRKNGEPFDPSPWLQTKTG
jgi:septal ring factor EnvC (AmiA/AmiB activator)